MTIKSFTRNIGYWSRKWMSKVCLRVFNNAKDISQKACKREIYGYTEDIQTNNEASKYHE